MIVGVHTLDVVADDDRSKGATTESSLFGGQTSVCTDNLYPGIRIYFKLLT